MNPVEDLKDREGYRRYQEAAAKAPVSKYPWGTLAGNTAAIMGGTALGYFSAGALTKILAGTRLGQRLGQMSDPKRRMLLAGLGSVAGASIAPLAGLAHAAGQMRVAERLAEQEHAQEAAMSNATKTGSIKVAEVLEIYDLAEQLSQS